MDKLKKIPLSTLVFIFICICLCVGCFAFGYIMYEVRHNTFVTGEIDIDLNGGAPVITADEYLFEPGMTVVKPLYIQNNGTWAVYYKLYFTQIDGELADVLDVTLATDDGRVLLAGKLSDLTEWKVGTVDDELEVGERRDMTVTFYFPPESGNENQDRELKFAVAATAVQTKNNPDKEFN